MITKEMAIFISKYINEKIKRGFEINRFTILDAITLYNSGGR